MNTPSAADVARYMLKLLEEEGRLEQYVAARGIEEQFGEIYLTDNSARAIAPAVLRQFRKLTGNRVIWDRSSLTWRWRQGADRPHRRADKLGLL